MWDDALGFRKYTMISQEQIVAFMQEAWRGNPSNRLVVLEEMNTAGDLMTAAEIYEMGFLRLSKELDSVKSELARERVLVEQRANSIVRLNQDLDELRDERDALLYAPLPTRVQRYVIDCHRADGRWVFLKKNNYPSF